VIETSSINRIHLSRPEDGRRAIFRNVDFIYFIFYIFIFYILFTIKTMDKVLITSGSQYHIPSSKPFRIQYISPSVNFVSLSDNIIPV
jgi:hypothetical protein